jgi:hypothetical protein
MMAKHLRQIRVARPVEDALLGNAPSGDRLAMSTL